MAMPPPSSPSDCNYIPFDKEVVNKSDSEDSQTDDSLHGHSPPPSLNKEVNLDVKIPSPIPSPTHTTNVTIAPYPPPVSTQPPTSTLHQNPIFSESTTTTNTVGPNVDVNASNAGAKISELQDLILTPFIAPITQKDLNALNVKLDIILTSSTASSSQAYFDAAVKGMINTLVKEHASNLDKANKAVEDSSQSCLQVTEKVDKLISNTKAFITESDKCFKCE
ncbi:unnamed protein product [Lactuca saligna]|uniref:Uncharacterized protein n=1 Tax=Lactuca saligna TaxID=75948 RepID=A0AA35YBU4_LACSI|nr:unnamed protein product [Lactuca saligna]